MSSSLGQILIGVGLAISILMLAYFVIRSKRAARSMSIIATNALLSVCLAYFFLPTLPVNAFTLMVMSLLGIPGTIGLYVIQSYLL